MNEFRGCYTRSKTLSKIGINRDSGLGLFHYKKGYPSDLISYCIPNFIAQMKSKK